MQAFLKNEYESADVIFISERAAPVAERYFSGVARKLSAQVRVIKSLDKMKAAVCANNWPKLCIVSSNELQTLSQKFEQGVMAVDFTSFDSKFDCNNSYFERFPHTKNNDSDSVKSSYVGMLQSMTNPEVKSTAENYDAVATITNDYDDTIIVNATVLEGALPADATQLYHAEQLQMVPYVGEIEDDNDSDNEPVLGCIIS
jgi:hypothetical protein